LYGFSNFVESAGETYDVNGDVNLLPSDIRLRDPLTEVTRKERRLLLGISAIGIVIVKTGLVPSKLSALGIEFGAADQQALITCLGVVVVYFFVSFLIYAASDLAAWRVAFHKTTYDLVLRSSQESEEERKRRRDLEAYRSRLGSWVRVSKPMAFLRAVFEFGVPIIIGLYAMALLFTATPPTTSQPRAATAYCIV
jgi:hypothetical protein